MKKLIAFLILLLFTLGLKSQDSAIAKIYGKNAVIFVKDSKAIKAETVATDKQLTIAISSNTYDSISASSLTGIFRLIESIRNNPPPIEAINRISLITNTPRDEITRSINLKLKIYSFWNYLGSATIIFSIILIFIKLNKDWRYSIVISTACLAAISLMIFVLPYISNYLINYNYIRMKEILDLSG